METIDDLNNIYITKINIKKMKKVLLVLAVIAFAFASCKHNVTPATTTVDSTTVAVDSTTVDSVSVDSVKVK